MTASKISCRCLVSGRVQGVYYRATAADKARELQIAGYAANLSDGRVEVLAHGEAAAIEAFTKWLWIGSSISKVTAVDIEALELPAGETPRGFVTR